MKIRIVEENTVLRKWYDMGTGDLNKSIDLKGFLKLTQDR